MHVEVVICWQRTVDLPGTKSMHAADGTFFTSASACVVAHLVLKFRLKTVIGCSSKMKTACLTEAGSPGLPTHSRVRLQETTLICLRLSFDLGRDDIAVWRYVIVSEAGRPAKNEHCVRGRR